MANPFAYNVLTNAGAALIAQATAANPIVFVEARSCATAAESAADLATKGKSWYTGKTGSISAVSAYWDLTHIYAVARICAYFGNAGEAQAAKAICVTARLASASDESAVVMCAISDPDSTIILPAESEIGRALEFPMNIAVNTTDVVQATPGASASIADLDRFVSMFRAGDPTQGEAQTILGKKTFSADMDVVGGIQCKSIKPIAAGPYTPMVGDPDAAYREAYFGDVYLERIKALDGYGISLTHSLGPINSTINLGWTTAPFHSVRSLEFAVYDAEGEFKTIAFDASGPAITFSGSIQPDEDGEYSCGSMSCNWDTVYTKLLALKNTHNIGIDGDDDIYIDGTLVPDGDGNCDLGTPLKKFQSVCAIELLGCLPYADGTEPLRGAILWVQVSFSSVPGAGRFPIGTRFQYHYGSPYVEDIWPAYMDGDTGAFAARASALGLHTGVYVTLCECGSANNTYVFAQVMRVE